MYGDAGPDPSPASGQETLEYLERANLFVVPLDNERRWYRYHHLFGELLRQRLQSRASGRRAMPGERRGRVARARQRLVRRQRAGPRGVSGTRRPPMTSNAPTAWSSKGRVPLHFPGAVTAVLDWLASLPKAVRDARPSLWVKSATLALVIGQTTGVDERLDAAEAALQGAEPDARTRDLFGQIAEARATLALTRYQVETMIVQARRALEYLHPDHLSFRSTAYWTLGMALFLAGDRVAAGQALTDALAAGEASGNAFSILLATIALGQVQEAENQLHRGGRDLPPLAATCGRSGAVDCLRGAAWPGSYLVPMERPRCR